MNPDDIKNPKYDLLPHMIKQIFGRVSNETVAKAGRVIHPSNYILDYIQRLLQQFLHINLYRD